MAKQCVFLSLFFVVSLCFAAYAADPGLDVEINKLSYGNEEQYEGSFAIGVGAEEVKGIGIKHPSLANPIILIENTGGFDGIELERKEEWTAFCSLLPNGSYDLYVKVGSQMFQYPFTINYALMPSTPVITFPTHGQVLSTPELTVTWESAPPGVEWVELDINDQAWPGTELGLNIDPASTSYTVPADLLKSGHDYEIELEFGTGAEGNDYWSGRTIAFSVAP